MTRAFFRVHNKETVENLSLSSGTGLWGPGPGAFPRFEPENAHVACRESVEGMDALPEDVSCYRPD